MYCVSFVKWIKFSVKKQNFKNKLEKWKKYWKSEAILSVRKKWEPCLDDETFHTKGLFARNGFRPCPLLPPL